MAAGGGGDLAEGSGVLGEDAAELSWTVGME